MSESFLSATRGSAAPRVRRGSALLALCVVLLQLVTALHFALIPHGFGPGLTGFVHVHAAQATARTAAPKLGYERRSAGQPSVVGGEASCTTDSCPLGFAGPSSVLLAGSEATGLLGLAVALQRARGSRYSSERSLVLLTAPKTSPPV
jgi:hypothetical protein